MRDIQKRWADDHAKDDQKGNGWQPIAQHERHYGRQ